MKFGKRLQSQLEETLPEWRDKYLSYKELKKRLKLISDTEAARNPDGQADGSAATAQAGGGSTGSNDDGRGNDSSGQGDGYDSDSSSGRGSHLHGQEQGSVQPDDGASDRQPPVAVPSDSQGSMSVNNISCKGDSSSAGSAIDDCSNPFFFLSAEVLKSLSPEEVDFMQLLNSELEKFNTFFMEKEEDYVIRLQELKERIESVKEKASGSEPSISDNELNEEMISIRRDIVNFHGEMVLLENYSSLNYTGLVKILKKHDKRTGALLRMPFIQNVLNQPFFTTELLSKLVTECEMNLKSLFPSTVAGSVSHQGEPNQHTEEMREGATSNSNISTNKEKCISLGGEDVESIYRSTMAALRTIKDLRRGSSTYNVFSLPPFKAKDDGDEELEKNGPRPCATLPVCSNAHEQR